MATSKEAPKKDKEDAAEVAAPPPPKLKKLIIIIVAAVVLVSALGAGAYMVFGGKKKAAADSEEVAEVEEEAEKPAHKWPKFDPNKAPVFMPLEPFTVNLQPENGEQFLQVVSSLRVIDSHIADQVKNFMPQIRHEILSLLSGKKPSEIITPEGREELANEMKDVINTILGFEAEPVSKKKKKNAEPPPVGPVVSVFFTQFIVQ